MQNTKSKFQIWCRRLYAILSCYRLSEFYDTTSINLCSYKGKYPIYISFQQRQYSQLQYFCCFWSFCYIRFIIYLGNKKAAASSNVIFITFIQDWYIFFLRFIYFWRWDENLVHCLSKLLAKHYLCFPLVNSFYDKQN